MNFRRWSNRAARATKPPSYCVRPKTEDLTTTYEQQPLEADDFCLVEDYHLEGFSGITELYYENEVRRRELTETFNGWIVRQQDSC